MKISVIVTAADNGGSRKTIKGLREPDLCARSVEKVGNPQRLPATVPTCRLHSSVARERRCFIGGKLGVSIRRGLLLTYRPKRRLSFGKLTSNINEAF